MNRKFSLIFLLLLFGAAMFAIAEPNGVQILLNSTESPTPQSAASITTAGGTFTTLILNATTQTPRWKAYVGNVTGKFELADANDYTIYDWNITTIAGEVYASRNTTITWSNIRCAVNSTMITEQNALNITTTKEDSINRTFNNTIHRGFYVGTTLIANDTCRAIATYVNNTRQQVADNATFQEILLDDTQSIVYSTLLENKARGYNTNRFDFQMIVAESEYNAAPSPYYFWAELS